MARAAASARAAAMTTTTDRWQTLVAGMGIVMLVFGLRIGILLQVQKYSEEMPIPARAEVRAEVPWASYLRAVDEALARNNVSAALHARRDAYGAALGSRRWEGALALGDAYVKIGEARKLPARRGSHGAAQLSHGAASRAPRSIGRRRVEVDRALPRARRPRRRRAGGTDRRGSRPEPHAGRRARPHPRARAIEGTATRGAWIRRP